MVASEDHEELPGTLFHRGDSLDSGVRNRQGTLVLHFRASRVVMLLKRTRPQDLVSHRETAI